MTVDNLQNLPENGSEKTPLTVQNEIQKEVFQQATVGENSLQKQLLQLLSSLPNPQQVQRNAQDQIREGFLDVKI